MLKFFRFPFATTGDKTAVPDAVDSNGNVSYAQGYGFDYQRQKTDPAAKNIERDKLNQILFDVTTAIAELQSQGAPDFITPALNGGTAYSYGLYAIVKYSGALYISLVAANTALPSDATKWALLPTPALLQQAAYISAAAGGTSDAITATFSPTITALPAAPGTLTLFVRAGAANTTTTPTFQAGTTAAKTIVKNNNFPLAVGDISGEGHWLILQYDPTFDRYVLLNPRNVGLRASGVAPITSNTTLTATAVGAIRLCQGAGGFTVTLPLASTIAEGERIELFCAAPNVTVQRQGVDAIQTTYAASGAVSSLVMGVGDSLTLIATASAGGWLAVGQPQLYASNRFAASRGANGYTVQPDGTIRQWGIATTSGVADVTVSFPISFPNGAKSVTAACVNGVTATPNFASIGSYGANSFTLGGWNSTGTRGAVSVFWEAVGY